MSEMHSNESEPYDNDQVIVNVPEQQHEEDGNVKRQSRRPEDHDNEPDDGIEEKSPRPVWLNALLLLFLIACGTFEGVSFHRSGVFLPDAFFGQFLFKVWIVLKMFMSAVGASMMVQGIMAAFNTEKFDQSRSYKVEKFGFIRVIGGSATLGVGMALCGTGPTMLPSQLGANVGHAWATLIGCLLGGLIYAVIEKLVGDKLKTGQAEEDEILVLEQIPVLKKARYQYIVIPAGLAMIGCSVGLELIIPHSKDEARLGAGSLPWLPTVAGLIIGGNQLPVRLITGEGKGGTASIMAIIGTLSCGILAKQNRVTSFKNAWQFCFVFIGITLGALISALTSPTTYSPVGFSIERCIIGGAFMILGARLAGGCTCGHGISGFSELSLESVAAVIAIFGSAIAMAYTLDAIGWN